MVDEGSGYVICMLLMIYLIFYLIYIAADLSGGKTNIVNNNTFTNSSIFNATLDFNNTTFNDTFTNFTDYEN